jgi:sugar porter (SP) family MFS transporter
VYAFQRGHLGVAGIATATAWGGLIYGYNIASIAGAILVIRQEFLLSPTFEEIVISAVLFGAVAGSALSGVLADRFGRRHVLLLTSGFCVLGTMGAAMATTVVLLAVFRLLVGVAIGLVSVAGPLYVAEIAPTPIRGRMVSYFTLAVATGIFAGYVADFVLSGHGHWRWMLGLGAVPGILLGMAMRHMPESPRWLLSHSYPERARDALSLLGAQDVETQVKAIQASLTEQSGTWKELLAPAVRPALFVGIGLALCREGGGANSFRVYAPTLFEFAGFRSAQVDILLAVAIGVVNVALAFVVTRLVDHVGRRPLLLVGLGGIVVSLVLFGLSFLFSNSVQGKVLGGITFVCILLLISSWQIGPASVTRLLTSEIFPLKVRGRALGIATVFQWGAYFLLTVPFLTLLTGMGAVATFWFYALLGGGALIFCYGYAPETKGRSLEEIEASWRSRENSRPPKPRAPTEEFTR